MYIKYFIQTFHHCYHKPTFQYIRTKTIVSCWIGLCVDNTSYECVCVHISEHWLMQPAGWSHLCSCVRHQSQKWQRWKKNKTNAGRCCSVCVYARVCVCVYEKRACASVWRSGRRPSQCYGQIVSPHMTATHSRTDGYKHIAFSKRERPC